MVESQQKATVDEALLHHVFELLKHRPDTLPAEVDALTTLLFAASAVAHNLSRQGAFIDEQEFIKLARLTFEAGRHGTPGR